VHPVEVFGHGPRLVSLQAPDEMPDEFPAGELFDLGQAFLQEILAEMFDSGAGCRIDCCGALALRNGQKRDGIDTSPRTQAGLGDACRVVLMLSE
jgi:hypothetical protein